MENYNAQLTAYNCQCLDDIRQMCTALVPESYRFKPWTYPGLNHGTSLLSTTDSLNCYMAAYGEMHYLKCKVAMQNFPFDSINGTIEIVDWGCGQGIGACSVIETLKQQNRINWLKKITLIEPSIEALNRAKVNVQHLTQRTITVEALNKYLPSSNTSLSDCMVQDMGYRYQNVIHVFSNVLDIAEIDLVKLAQMIGVNTSNQFVLCISPLNSAAYRIKRFCSIFGEQNYFSKVTDAAYSHLSNGHSFSCLTRCFEYGGTPLDFSHMQDIEEITDPLYDDYDLQLHIQNNVLSTAKARVFWRLQHMLAMDDVFYTDVEFNECVVDFVIIRPNVGVLLVNIFDDNILNYRENEKEEKKHIENSWKTSSLEHSKVILVHKETEQAILSPLYSIQMCQASLREGINKILIKTIDNARNFRLIKKAVIFPHNDVTEIQSFVGADKYIAVFGSEFWKNAQVAQQLFTQTGFCRHDPEFDEPTRHQVIHVISPKWHSLKEGRLGIRLTREQKALSESRPTMQKISGVAGSGKTQVLVTRAMNAHKRTGGNVLILTYNITLANYLHYRLNEMCEDFSWEKFHIYHYHHFFRLMAHKHKCHVGFSSYTDLDFFKYCADNIERYAAIFIDEIQDYDMTWLRILEKYFLVPHEELVVFGDPKQNVYHRELDKNEDIRIGVIPGEWKKSLQTSHRFTNPLLAYMARKFQQTFFPSLTPDNFVEAGNRQHMINFNIISYVDLRNQFTIEKVVDKCIEIIRQSDLPDSDFTILGSTTAFLRSFDAQFRQQTGKTTRTSFISQEIYDKLLNTHQVSAENSTANWKFANDYNSMERLAKYHFTTETRCIKISTIQSFKGWESPAVILILEDLNKMPHENELNLNTPEVIYAGITRSRDMLSIINLGNELYHDFFNTLQNEF